MKEKTLVLKSKYKSSYPYIQKIVGWGSEYKYDAKKIDGSLLAKGKNVIEISYSIGEIGLYRIGNAKDVRFGDKTHIMNGFKVFYENSRGICAYSSIKNEKIFEEALQMQLDGKCFDDVLVFLKENGVQITNRLVWEK